MKTLPFFCLSATLLVSQANAALLVYEGFDGYTAGAMGSVGNTNPNVNTVGLDKTTASGGSGLSNSTYTTSGMSFGSLAVNGGALTFNRPTNGSAVIAGKMALTTPAGSTVWNSYLINISAAQSAAGDGFHSRIATDTGTGGIHFQTFPDNRGGTASTEAGVRYIDGTTLSGASLTLGVDYFILGSFTNVGSVPSVGTPAVATMYAFNLAQFGNLMAATDRQQYLQDLTQGGSDTQATIKVSQTLTSGSTQTFISDQFAHLVAVGVTGKVDELRWSNDLASAIPVPEPGTGALGLLACLSAAFRRRRSMA
ncbi:MAG TPA: hypothetical protein VM511_06695 [Luteolibacter sp.]|nr:hypothetical protein [Luteolibacter sp.]